MTIETKRRYRVSIPLAKVKLYIVADSPDDAVRAALEHTKEAEGRTVTLDRHGPNWRFYRVSPPLPDDWLGNHFQSTPVNPKNISVIEVEDQGEILLLVRGTQDGSQTHEKNSDGDSEVSSS